ncbi:MAG: SPFH domain-containing protein [Ruminococcus sp.]|nr:SPFH domain-containing protein [Ruminococcus sp.]
MGLIKAALGAVGGKLADEWQEYFRCDGMDQRTFCIAGTKVSNVRGGSNQKGTESYISNGSVFDVAINQAALLVEDGKVHDLVVATDNDIAGQYRYDSTTAPSLLGGGLKDFIPSLKDIGGRFVAGGMAKHTMRLVYINLKPMIGNKIGFGNVPFRDGEMNLSLNAQGHGEFELRVVDPVAFYENNIHDISQPFVADSGDGATFMSQLKTDMKPKFGICISELSKKQIPYDQIIAYADDLAEIMNQKLTDKWADKGVQLKSLSVELNVDEESKKKIAQFQEADAANRYGRLGAMDAMSVNRAREAAASNTAGAFTGFMGMGFGGNSFNQNAQMSSGLYGNGGGAPGYNPNGNQPVQPQGGMGGAFQQPQQPAPDPNAWTCSCGTQNTGKFCQNCGQPQPAPAPAPSADGWTCACGTVNQGKFCQNCGQPKPADAPLYKCDKCGWVPDDPKNPPKFCPQCGDVFDDKDIQ